MSNAPASNGPLLRDIHLPQVSWWPPAPGWWLLATLILFAIIAIVLIAVRYRQRRRPRLAARRELDLLAARHLRDRDDAALAAGLSRLLRRAALTIDPAAATRDGAAWRAFLDCCAPGMFTDAQLDLLIDAPYRERVSFDAPALLDAARKWCERALRARKRLRLPGEGESNAMSMQDARSPQT